MQTTFLDEAEEHDRWVFGRNCPGGKINTIKEQKNRTLEMAKKVCSETCNLLELCDYATLYYDEETTREECTLRSENCGDWVNYGNQLDRYFYQKGTLKIHIKKSL